MQVLSLAQPAPVGARQDLRRLGRQHDYRLVVVDLLLDGSAAAAGTVAPRPVAVRGGGRVGVTTAHAIPVQTPLGVESSLLFSI